MIFADPPYNVRIDGHVSGLGKHRHHEFVQWSGEMTDAEFHQFLLAFMLLCARFARAGALHYIFIDWAHAQALLATGGVAYDVYINLCIWAKTNAGMGSLYRSQHELIAIFKKGKLPHRNNVMLGANGRHRSNLWSYAGMNVPSNARNSTLSLHRPLSQSPSCVTPCSTSPAQAISCSIRSADLAPPCWRHTMQGGWPD